MRAGSLIVGPHASVCDPPTSARPCGSGWAGSASTRGRSRSRNCHLTATPLLGNVSGDAERPAGATAVDPARNGFLSGRAAGPGQHRCATMDGVVARPESGRAGQAARRYWWISPPKCRGVRCCRRPRATTTIILPVRVAAGHSTSLWWHPSRWHPVESGTRKRTHPHRMGYAGSGRQGPTRIRGSADSGFESLAAHPF
jgi:hypothetical protein